MLTGSSLENSFVVLGVGEGLLAGKLNPGGGVTLT